MPKSQTKKQPAKTLFGLLKPYSAIIGVLIVLTIAGNALNLFVPKIIANAIDTYTNGNFMINHIIVEFLIAGSSSSS